MEYKIGNLRLKNKILLAPMLEPSDIAFRLLCKKAGCGLTYTGMVSPLSKQKMFLDDKPAVQLFGNSVKGIKSFIKKYDSEVSLWDFNLGCPSKLSKRFGHGGCLDDVDVIVEIVKVMRNSTDKPVTIKLRKSEKAIEIARRCEEFVDAIGIHARSVGQGYSGEVDYDFALSVKRAVKCPVIFSGVNDLGEVDSILEDFDFVMLGRLAIGNPGIFSGKTIGFGEYLKLAKKYGLLFRQVKFQAMNFTKGFNGARELRGKLIDYKNIKDLESAMGSQAA